MRKIINMEGMAAGRWTVLRMAGTKKGSALWLCRCSCGNEGIVDGYKLRSGRSKSCGCLQVESVTSHGLRKHLLYPVWGDMKDRCINKNDESYRHYGGRGILVCDEWLDNFQAFYDFCMENGWRKGLQIDRIDNDGNYEPDNCRFVTSAVNNQNSSRTKLTEDDVLDIRNRAKTETHTQLAEEFGVCRSTITLTVNHKRWKEDLCHC